MADQPASSFGIPRIVVVGSINMDLVATMPRLPRPGETVTGTSFQSIPGGKGANQAVAAARLGASVSMIGRVGDDSFGTTLRQNLIESNVATQAVFTSPQTSSGVALIGVDHSGANCITVIPAANGLLSVQDVQQNETLIATAKALIVQLETPAETVDAAIQLAQRHGVTTVLDPAPAPTRALPPALLDVDIISPNQTEAEVLTGIPVHDFDSATRAAHHLQSLGARTIVIKMGELGALVCLSDGSTHPILALKANIVDSTAAGDAFTAALTVALCEGKSLVAAAEFASQAGTLACTRFGAQPAMPTRNELESWLAGRNSS